MLTDSDWHGADADLAFFRRNRTAITVTEKIVIKRMTTHIAPMEVPNVRPLTEKELDSEVPVAT